MEELEQSVGKKLKIEIVNRKDRIERITGKLLKVYPSYVLLKTPNYNTTFLKTDFINGASRIVKVY